MQDVWQLVHAERAALVADLATLDETEWKRPSLCEGWTVHDVAAHLVDTALTTRLGFVRGLAMARFDFDRQNQRGLERHRGAAPRHTLESLREVATRTSAPPGSLASRLVEEVVHGEDIRRPLGLTRDYPVDTVTRALRYQVATSAAIGGARDRAVHLRLEATDVPLTIGAGDPVSGTLLDLLLGVSGRRSELTRLSGPGVDLLRQRP